jgi:hypothetical protein
MWENIPSLYIRNKGEIEKVGIARYKPKPKDIARIFSSSTERVGLSSALVKSFS